MVGFDFLVVLDGFVFVVVVKNFDFDFAFTAAFVALVAFVTTVGVG